MYREGGRRGSQPIFSLKQDRRIKNNSINILPIVIKEKEQHSRLNTRPYVQGIWSLIPGCGTFTFTTER